MALRGRFVSRSGTIMSYGISNAGSDWTTLKFINIVTGTPLDDVISECKFTSQVNKIKRQSMVAPFPAITPV